MSYILDALKKSDRERNQEEVPGLASIHDPYPYSPKQQSSGQWKKYLLASFAFTLLISVSTTFWYLQRKSSGSAEKIVIYQKQLDTVTVETNTAEDSPEIKTAETEQKHPPTPVSLKRTQEKIIIPYQETPPPEQQATVIQPTVRSGTADIPELEDLPDSLREGIPELHFAGHTYADDPTRRMIIINNKIVREGEKAGNSLRLVEITWTGVIMNYRGQLFKIDID